MFGVLSARFGLVLWFALRSKIDSRFEPISSLARCCLLDHSKQEKIKIGTNIGGILIFDWVLKSSSG